ncbi:MAG: hypothetical protein LBC73_01945 [Oscillospiraceae bacterium]|jgi:hypothetical protein|nr:hypothetical protein [Oscillospiraceae bacterium]
MMQSKNGVIAISLIGIIVIAFTLATFFLLEIEKSVVNIWALSFLLLSEVTLFAGLISLRFTGEKHNTLFVRAGFSVALSLYFIITLVSVLFAASFEEHLKTFILIELAIIALFVIAAISIFTWSRGIARRNEVDMTKIGTKEPKRGSF